MPWYVFALLTAAFWGLLYTLAENVTKGINKTSYLLICSFVQTIVLGVVSQFQNRLSTDIQFLWKTPLVMGSLLGIILISLGGNYLSLMAIQLKNASMAAAVETTYPLWTAMFAYLIFGHVQLTPVGLAGTLLVMIGILLVVTTQG